MAQPEAKVKAKIKKALLEIWPDMYHLMPVPGGFGQNGVPDHLACVPVKITQSMVGQVHGMFIAVEAKTATGKTKGIQHVQLAKIIKSGGFASIVYGEGQVDDLITKLNLLFKEK